jgi:hypothetical protein
VARRTSNASSGSRVSCKTPPAHRPQKPIAPPGSRAGGAISRPGGPGGT